MNFVRKLWPFSFEVKGLTDLLVKAILYIVLTTLVIVLMSVVKDIVVINVIMAFIGCVSCIYLISGLILLFLSYYKIIK